MKWFILSRWAHIMAVTLWLGGQLFLVGIALPAIRRAVDPKTAYEVVDILGKRFSKITWYFLFPIILVTGFYNAIFKISPYILFRTSYGSVFLLKLAIFVVVVFFSYMHDFVWGPKAVEMAREGKNAENIRKRVILIPRFTLLLGVFMVLLGAILWAGGI
jgi:uncharacterized membrane protein